MRLWTRYLYKAGIAVENGSKIGWYQRKKKTKRGLHLQTGKATLQIQKGRLKGLTKARGTRLYKYNKTKGKKK